MSEGGGLRHLVVNNHYLTVTTQEIQISHNVAWSTYRYGTGIEMTNFIGVRC